ncbi:MAG: hypothetical protein JO101_04330 [Candidatus Eremiobacteraeota bacterium]|nr:hypothetical protein [Candidatus Eremiobacteraeota bacterium]MBV8354524.1 hypothetical protein [Candidatus Eremiobacteraeota bacterium]
MTVVLASAFLALGLINLDFRSSGWWQGQRRRLVAGLPLVVAYAYFSMPPLVFPQAITFLLLTLVPNTVYSFAAAARTFIIARRIVSIRRAPVLPYVIACAAVAAYGIVLTLAPIVDAGGLRDLASVVETSSPPPNADLAHVRVVPLEAARFAGDKVIGQLGTYYQVGNYTVQLAGGRLVWAAALEFHDPIQWMIRRTSPGVIVVSAENADAPAELRQRAPMRYIPSAYLNDNLYRHVYLRYGTEEILETTLQLDDAGNPKELATLGRPTVGWTGERVTAVVIVDPVSGAMQRIPRAEFASLPRWISRVIPPDLALAYNLWYGLYIHGFWNSVVAKRDVHLPARAEVFGMLISGERFVWFVDHTSPATTDASMTGFTYMDSRTGAMTYYTATGGEFSSAGAENAIRANPIVRQGRLLPTQPILYNVFGQNTWVVPIIADNGKYQTLGLVQATNGRVVVGNPSAASTSADAFSAYGDILGGRVAAGGGTKVGGTLDRIAQTGAAIYFTLRGDRRIFSLHDLGSPDAVLARSGDRVAFSIQGEEGGMTLTRDFHDISLGTKPRETVQ